MPITLLTHYSKKCGIPHYSSISASASVEVELHDLEAIPSEIEKLYHVLQSSVDSQLAEHVGFVPEGNYGVTDVQQPSPNGNGHSIHSSNGNHNHGNNGSHSTNGAFQCSEKQRTLILDLQKQLGLSDADLDEHSHQLFSKPVRQLNKLSASGLITALLEMAGKSNGRNGNRNGHRPATNGGGR
ncbi:MAG: hypothetical protein P1U85_01705 [Verrucomicrobiales bacterium]|nr:hypothetical protein [Verrucomicrobiales bacterium]